MAEDLADRIYEAAFVPDLWPGALERISLATGFASGELQLMTLEGSVPEYQATPLTQVALGAFIAAGKTGQCERAGLYVSSDYTGFVCISDHMSAEQLERDPVPATLEKIGLGWQVGAMTPLPTGELASFTFERWLRDGRAPAASIARLEEVRPHLARATLVAARLGLERARATASALQSILLPAAVLRASGHVVATNALFDSLSAVFRPTAFGGLALADASAQALLKASIEAGRGASEPTVRSFPIARDESGPPLVLHVLPLRRNARDVVSGGDLLLAATTVCASRLVPDPSVLSGLFDLTPAEARFAAALTRLGSLKQASSDCGIAVSTARSYLERIFLKTGTHGQAALVALLQAAHSIKPSVPEARRQYDGCSLPAC